MPPVKRPPKLPRLVTLKAASTAEAHRRIAEIFDPYMEHLHNKHDSSLLALVADLRMHMMQAFEDFGFEDVPLGDDK